MKQFRLTALFSLSFGSLGVAGCVAATVALWFVSSGLRQTNESVFDGIDRSLVFIRNQIRDTQARVLASKVTIDEIQQGLKDRARSRAQERLFSETDVEQRAEQLLLVLQQADMWLARSGESILAIQQVLDIGRSIGAPVNSSSLEPLLGELVSMRDQLQQTTETVGGIRDRVAEITEEGREERRAQAVRLAVRVVATLAEVDSRLGEYLKALDETQTKLTHVRRKTNSYIVAATLVTLLVIVWMAAGQVALCRYGWKEFAAM